MMPVTAPKQNFLRRLPQGAEIQPDGGVHFRIWEPDHKDVRLVIENRPQIALEAEGQGFFAGYVATAGAGARYKFRLDGGDLLCPDPMSRFQPKGPHGPSQVIDPNNYRWQDTGWKGVRREGVNLGPDLHLDSAPQPLLGAPTRAGWEILWASEDPCYGGLGYARVETDEGWRIGGRQAFILKPADGSW
ncbi:hypothetical protein ACFPL7_12290 [Dongia soli]|uniref:Glycoside hydrolase family 13 N-terminal domain-containing protein n=1 Tax=Dongia soli TaxID=600628 RepID=A0ABU5EIB3_9PROT|nr:hypothetical protein [Dongia soli]MDY0885153.1 hypothetical protein [Dongia soli]